MNKYLLILEYTSAVTEKVLHTGWQVFEDDTPMGAALAFSYKEMAGKLNSPWDKKVADRSVTVSLAGIYQLEGQGQDLLPETFAKAGGI